MTNTLSDTEIRETILSALRAIAPEADPKTLDPDIDLREQVDLDSMDFLNLMVSLHKKMGVEIPEADYPKLRSLAGIAVYLKGQLEAKKTAG